MEIARTQYLAKLNALRDQKLIKVITGLRRTGKSTLLRQFQEQLLKDGVSREQIHSYNFEIIGTPTDYLSLHTEIQSKMVAGKQNYIFLDEVQNINQFEKAVDSLYAQENTDIYITGSNAFMLSGELSTLLSGRYIEINLLPLSFSEYLKFFSDRSDFSMKYANYVKNGGMPQAFSMFEQGEDIGIDYLRGVYNTVIMKDVIQHQNFRDPEALENVIKYLFDNIGKKVSPNSIANYMKSNYRSIDQRTVEKIISAVCGSFIMYSLDRYNIKGKELLQTQQKYYLTDLAFRRVILGLKDNQDFGYALENTIFLELKRRGYQLWIGKTKNNYEIDFVAKSPTGIIEYYQVSESLANEATKERELRALTDIADNYPKYIITNDPVNYEHDGIRIVNAVDWLVGK